MVEVSRRGLLIGGGAGVGLVVAWALWPRDYRPALVASPGEHPFGAWLKIGEDGHVTVAVPQAEHGQGVLTTLPQIVADELGADWRTVAVEAAPIHPLYANPLGVDALFEGLFDTLPEGVRERWATRSALMLTAGATSLRQFERPCREAGAAARALLCQAAGRRWGVEGAACTVAAGFVVHGARRLRFAELAAEAAHGTPPDPLPIGMQGAGKLSGQSVPRLDAPSKVDGTANFTGDIRLADMVHAAVRAGPTRTSRLLPVDHAAADRIRGVVQVVEAPHWVAAVATTGWAAQRALDALAPRFADDSPLAATASIDAALARALAAPGRRMAGTGDVDAVLEGPGVITADYRAAAAVHAGIETPAATAAYRDGRLELWLPTLAPGLARAAAARAAGVSEAMTVVHPMQLGGSFGAGLETEAAAQAAVLAVQVKRPVSLIWSRGESLLHDPVRSPAAARMSARLAGNGAILGWRAAIAAAPTGHDLAGRMIGGVAVDAALALAGRGDRYAVAGALPPYRLPAAAVLHHPADLGIDTGHLTAGAHGYTAFFTECFLDELARAAGMEPVSYRIGMLGGEPRLARCLSTAASLGGWDGGAPGTGQGIAAHAFRGSYVAVLAEAEIGANGRPRVDRLVAAVDCGQVIHPDIVRQNVERGLMLGLAAALGASTGHAGGLPTVRGFDTLPLPRLADTPDITVELIRSDEAPGGVSGIALPPVAPAIANALFSATGNRIRHLPLVPLP